MVSIIIPTFNRYQTLSRTLGSIVDSINICDNKNVEVIVIDNGSTDKTKEVCQSFDSKISNLIYFYEPEPGLLSGRHKGVEISKGSILSFLDDDVILNPKWLSTIFDVSNKHPDVSLFGGPSIPEFEARPPYWLKYFWKKESHRGKSCGWLSLLDFDNDEIIIDPKLVWGLNFNIRKTHLFEAGGFNPDCIPKNLQCFQGDGETGISIKLASRNMKAMFFKNLSVLHIISSDRLNAMYFEQRAYYQGVSDSYSHIREKHFKICYSETKSKFAKKTHNIINKIANKWSCYNEPNEIKQLRRNLKNKYFEGYRFHQDAFNMQENVKNWVLKPDYFDYKLPIN